MSGGRRWWLAFIVIVFAAIVFTAPAKAQIGEIDTLLERADAVVIVEVAFVPYGDLVLLGETLHGKTVDLAGPNDLLGDCLPNRVMVKELASKSARSVQADVYEEALERATYTAVIFLQHAANRSSVLCTDTGNSTENWESDPRHSTWRARLDAYLDDID
jgi:Holliday junction resolvase-like predicted endonuclease